MPDVIEESHALTLDEGDPVPTLRDRFLIPPATAGPYPETAYLAGNSLGLQLKTTRALLGQELDDWARLAVEGHFEARRPWTTYQRLLVPLAARLIGAAESETVIMNTLTVNLHLMMLSFYRPTAARSLILIEDNAFSSDRYAVRSQAMLHGLDPDVTVVRLRPRDGEDLLRTDDVLSYLAEHGDRVALVLLGAVNYLTGELLDIETITRAGRAAGAVVGWDLAHAVANVALRLHEWDVDWAAWCSYKYLNAGPGAIAGAFVHERHLADPDLPKLNGWWGASETSRFQMTPELIPTGTAQDWQLSCPPILSLAPVLESLQLFDEVGMDALRGKSMRLTGYLESVLDLLAYDRGMQIITPRDAQRRGAQLSVRVTGIAAPEVIRLMRHEHGVIADARQPDVVRLAPAPLYSTYHDGWRAAHALAQVLDRHAGA